MSQTEQTELIITEIVVAIQAPPVEEKKAKKVKVVNNVSAGGGKLSAVVIALTEEQELEKLLKEQEDTAKRIAYLSHKNKRIASVMEDREHIKETMAEEIQKLHTEIADKLAIKNEMEEKLTAFLRVQGEEQIYRAIMNDECWSSIAYAEEKAEKKAGGSRGKGTRTFIDREAYPDMLPDKLVLIAINPKDNKMNLRIIFNEDTKKFYRYSDKKEYAKLQDANKEWTAMLGKDKLGNAWELFRAEDQSAKGQPKKTRGIENLHNENWVDEEGADEYINEAYKF